MSIPRTALVVVTVLAVGAYVLTITWLVGYLAGLWS